MKHINQSEMTTFVRCRRKWDWTYREDLVRPGYESNLSTGSAVHAALQAYYSGKQVWPALEDYWREAAEALHPEDPAANQLAKDMTLSNVMVEGYFEWLAETAEDAGLTTVAVEEKVEMPMGKFYGNAPLGITDWSEEVTLHGTLDLVQADENGHLWLVDHKTCKDFGVLADRRLVMNFQLLTYAVLCEEYFGQPIHGAKLNMLRKVLRTGNAKPPFYHRESVTFNRHQLDAHRTHMKAIIQDLLEVELGYGAVYPVVDGDCSWKCPFLSVCALADDGGDIEGALNDLYVRRTGE